MKELLPATDHCLEARPRSIILEGSKSLIRRRRGTAPWTNSTNRSKQRWDGPTRICITSRSTKSSTAIRGSWRRISTCGLSRGGAEFQLLLPVMASGRYPDLGVVLRGAPSDWRGRTLPALAAEVVSPSSVQRDYETKREEYLAYGLLEYWIVDPQKRQAHCADAPRRCLARSRFPRPAAHRQPRSARPRHDRCRALDRYRGIGRRPRRSRRERFLRIESLADEKSVRS